MTVWATINNKLRCINNNLIIQLELMFFINGSYIEISGCNKLL